MNRRYLYIFGVFIVVVIAIFILVRPGDSSVERIYSKVTGNIQNPWLNNDRLDYFTGSFFARYNFESNKIDRLSDYMDIKSGISEVNWIEGSVVFRTNPSEGDRDDVTTAASQLGTKSHSPHWWRYDLAAKQYQLLDFGVINSCVSVAQINSNQFACIERSASGNTTYSVYIFNISTRSAEKVYSGSDTISELAAFKDRFSFIKTSLAGKQGLYVGKLGATKPVSIYEGVGDLSYRLSGTDEITVSDVEISKNNSDQGTIEDNNKTPESKKYDLVLIKGGEVVKRSKIKTPALNFYYGSGDQIMISILDGSIYELSEKEGLVQIAQPSQTLLSDGDVAFMVYNKYYVLKFNGTLLSADYFEKTTKNSEDFSSRRDFDKTGNSWIDDSAGGVNDAYLYLPAPRSSDQELAVGNGLATRGFEPAEFKFNWIVDGVDFKTPIQPNAIVIR